MSITTVTNHDLSRQVQNSQARGRIKTCIDAIVTKVNAITTGASGFLTADTDGRAVMATGYFDEATATAKFAALAITTGLLKAGILAASTSGRALMATGYFTEAKATDAFAAGAIDGATLLKDASVPCGKLATSVRSAPQALSGAGAINITTATTLFTSTGGAQALTLADSTVAGQRKRIIHVADGGSGVITQTTGAKLTASIATITFTNVWDWVELEWSGSLWNVIGYGGVTIATS